MSSLTFTLKERPEFELNVSALIPDKLIGKTSKQICATKLSYGNQKVTVSRLFSVSGNDAESIRIQRSCTRLTHIGQNMSKGQIQVRGDTGDNLGKGMRGGLIKVSGDAGSWTAAGMVGGKIEISGDCGDFLAASNVGEPHGMSDGTIIVHGSAGSRVGERMRRGMIVIFGHAGEYCANQMLAGTIIILGKTGAYLGFGMKRGTIVLAKKPRQLLATFRHCGLLKIEFLRLLFKQLALSCKPLEFFRGFGPEAIRYAGDTSCGGMGEILILRNARLPR